MKSAGSNSRRQDLLVAAAAIVNHEGASKLTLDAVAQKAGVSKGGLLYHFPTKEELVKAMVREMGDSFIQSINHSVQSNHGMKWSEAYAKATFEANDNENEMSSALLAAIFTNPQLLQSFQEGYEQIQENIMNSESDPVAATILRLAADGLWFAETFGLAPIESDLKKQVYDRLVALIRESKME